MEQGWRNTEFVEQNSGFDACTAKILPVIQILSTTTGINVLPYRQSKQESEILKAEL